MPPKKYAMRGKPDFTNVSDEKLKLFMDLTQQMIFAYNHYDDEKAEVLSSIWKDLNIEDSERVSKSACEALEKDEVPATMLKKVPKVRKSPAKRRI